MKMKSNYTNHFSLQKSTKKILYRQLYQKIIQQFYKKSLKYTATNNTLLKVNVDQGTHYVHKSMEPFLFMILIKKLSKNFRVTFRFKVLIIFLLIKALKNKIFKKCSINL